MDNTIRAVKVNDSEFFGEIKTAEIVFGPHHIIRLDYNENNELVIYLISTHHGVCLKASTGGSLTELEDAINKIRQEKPETGVDSIGWYPASKRLIFDQTGILKTGNDI